MGDLKKDTNAQWIALSGLAISLILISLAALANQAVIAGYHSSNAALEFPKENIRELNSHTRENAKIIKDLSIKLNKTNNDTIPVIYESLFDNYTMQMKGFYALHGETVDLSLVSLNSSDSSFNHSSFDMVFVNISYNDGTVSYISDPEVIEVES